MKKLLFQFFAIFVCLSSCTDDYQTSELQGKINQKCEKEIISDVALSFAKSIKSTNIRTRTTCDQMKVDNIQKLIIPYSINMTRANTDEHNFYSVSLKDNNGTVLLSSKDSVVLPLAYFMNESNIDINQVVKDSISDLSFLLTSIIGDEIKNSNIDAVNKNNMIKTSSNIVEKVSPKCKVAWHQNSPYNKYCFTSDGKQAMAGCVAIAGAQALTILRPIWPNITSWDDIVKENPTVSTIDEIAKLIHFIGEKTDMKYGVNSSGTKAYKLSSLFRSYGINTKVDDAVIETLNKEKGVIVVSGYRSKHGWGPTKHYVDGHAFIADGYIKYENEENPYYLHLNYGWGPYYQRKEVYLLNCNKHWDESAGNYYGIIFPYKITFLCYYR